MPDHDPIRNPGIRRRWLSRWPTSNTRARLRSAPGTASSRGRLRASWRHAVRSVLRACGRAASGPVLQGRHAVPACAKAWRRLHLHRRPRHEGTLPSRPAAASIATPVQLEILLAHFADAGGAGVARTGALGHLGHRLTAVGRGRRARVELRGEYAVLGRDALRAGVGAARRRKLGHFFRGRTAHRRRVRRAGAGGVGR